METILLEFKNAIGAISQEDIDEGMDGYRDEFIAKANEMLKVFYRWQMLYE